MARFYAKFDHTADTTLDSDYFEIGKVTTSTVTAAALKAGLIASRSALSADINVDTSGIEAVNRDGQRGTYIPYDIISVAGSAPTQTYGWSPSLYTASAGAGAGLQGIRTPANYRTRPTASILTSYATAFPTQFGLVVPVDTGTGRNYNLYLSASAAVYSVLNNLVSGSGNTSIGPYVRKGTNESRTLHSIWHDADLNYFAWDDFTPGTPGGFSSTVDNFGVADAVTGNGTVVFLEVGVDELSVNYFWSGQYKSDSRGGIDLIGSLKRSNGAAVVTPYSFNASTTNAFTYNEKVAAGFLVDNTYNQRVTSASLTVQFRDPTINSHTGPITTEELFPLTYASSPIIPQTIFGETVRYGSGAVNDTLAHWQSNICTQGTATVYVNQNDTTDYQFASEPKPRIYGDKSGSQANSTLVSDANLYISFGTLNNGKKVYKVVAGKVEDSATVTCGSTTTTTTIACTSFLYSTNSNSLSECQVGSWPTTGYRNNIFGVGSIIYTNNTCTSALTGDEYIQVDDGLNIQLNTTTGAIVDTLNPLC
jgi:hypothetical protein